MGGIQPLIRPQLPGGGAVPAYELSPCLAYLTVREKGLEVFSLFQRVAVGGAGYVENLHEDMCGELVDASSCVGCCVGTSMVAKPFTVRDLKDLMFFLQLSADNVRVRFAHFILV